MSRKIISLSQNTPLIAGSIDNYADRLVKLIPAEIVSLYLFLQAFVSEYGESYNWVLWLIILALIVLTPLYLRSIMNVDDWRQLLFTTIAFIIWTFIFGAPYSQYFEKEEIKLFSTVILSLYTFAIPVFYK